MPVEKSVKRRDKPIVLKPSLWGEPYEVRPRGKVVVEVDGKKVGSAKANSRIELKPGRLSEGVHGVDELTLPKVFEGYELVVTRKTVTFQKSPTPPLTTPWPNDYFFTGVELRPVWPIANRIPRRW